MATACTARLPPESAPLPPTPAPPAAVHASDPPTIAEPVQEQAVEIPTGCPGAAHDVCFPDAEFVARLCERRYPGVALGMFARSTPWTRAYVRARSVVAWSASGPATEKITLGFDEEVIVLGPRKALPGAMTINGGGDTFDVLRWDGTCVTLDRAEITRFVPPSPKAPDLPWKHYDDALQEALLQDAGVAAADKVRRSECRGMTIGGLSESCSKASHALSRAIIRYVRMGGKVPMPSRLP